MQCTSQMSFFNWIMSNNEELLTPTKRQSQLLPDPDMDCPNLDCMGWLRVFGDLETNEPKYVKCSEIDCKQKTILSKFGSQCKHCRKAIHVS